MKCGTKKEEIDVRENERRRYLRAKIKLEEVKLKENETYRSKE